VLKRQAQNTTIVPTRNTKEIIMGNRAIVHFTNTRAARREIGGQMIGEGFSVYQHWNADDVKVWLAAAAPTMRQGDEGYAAARWAAFLCDTFPGGLSVGLQPSPFDPENGLYVVDCDTGKVTLFREGLDGNLARSGRPFNITMGVF
jgi:hypothetical protein